MSMSGQAAGFGMMKLYAHPDNYKTKKARPFTADPSNSDLQKWSGYGQKAARWMAMADRNFVFRNLVEALGPCWSCGKALIAAQYVGLEVCFFWAVGCQNLPGFLHIISWYFMWIGASVMFCPIHEHHEPHEHLQFRSSDIFQVRSTSNPEHVFCWPRTQKLLTRTLLTPNSEAS